MGWLDVLGRKWQPVAVRWGDDDPRVEILIGSLFAQAQTGEDSCHQSKRPGTSGRSAKGCELHVQLMSLTPPALRYARSSTGSVFRRIRWRVSHSCGSERRAGVGLSRKGDIGKQRNISNAKERR